MPKEYRTIDEVAGPLMLVRDVENVNFDELGEIERTIAKEICKCGRAFPCRIHGFVVY